MKFTSVVLSVFMVSSFGFAKDLKISQIGQIDWELQPSARKNFNFFLDEKSDFLKKQNLGFHFPENESNLPQSVFKFFNGASDKFVNREASCRFLKKISSLTGDAQISLNLSTLTQNFSVCIARDLPPSERTDWEFKMIRFIWNERWLNVAGKQTSLFEYITERMKVPLKTSDLQILHLDRKDTPLDAYGYAYSPRDFEVVRQTPLLQEILNLGETYSPNNPKAVDQFGPQVQDVFNANPTELAAFFLTKPTIYITANWSPVDLPEILTHEFGHVVHDLHREFLVKPDGLVFIRYDRLQEEAAAEAFAWQALCDLYQEVPELMYMHVTKLQIMAQFKSNDPHLVGAAAFAKDFHYQCGHTEKFMKFVNASELEDYPVANSPLLKRGKAADRELSFRWQ